MICHRSWSLGIWLVAACAVTCLMGCRNNAAQTDLIQREMRNQEDQIYALQDYLSEYQQLLCDARSENEALRQQLVRDQFREGAPQPRGSQPSSPSKPPMGPNGTPPEIKIDDNIEMTLPEAPPVELPEAPPVEPVIPDPPPLDTTSRDEQADAKERQVVQTAVEETDAEETDAPPEAPAVVVAGYTEPASRTADEVSPPAAVAVRAEVSRGEEANGPRVLIDVLPLASDGEPAAFAGALSVMFMDGDAIGNTKELARWDFAADELAQFARETTHGTTYVFPLQLPRKVPTNRPVEFWVRLVPTEGEKVLSHAPLDLSRPGRFVFDERKRPKRVDHSVRAAAAVLPNETSRVDGNARHSGEDADGWKVARLDDVPRETPSTDARDGTWRTATQPIPVVESRPVRPDPLDRYERGADARFGSESDDTPRDAPKWLPERPRVASPPADHILSPPTWSANR